MRGIISAAGSARASASKRSRRRRSVSASAVEAQAVEEEHGQRQRRPHLPTSSVRPNRRIVTWNGCGAPPDAARSLRRRGSARARGTRAQRVDDLRRRCRDVVAVARKERRMSSPALCTCMRAPSIFHSNAAVPNARSASPMSSAGCASIGATGCISTSANGGGRPRRRSVRRAPRWRCRSRPSPPGARSAAGSDAAAATASIIKDSSAPCRNSPTNRRTRKSRSSSVARANSFGQDPRALGLRTRSARRGDALERGIDIEDGQRRRIDGIRRMRIAKHCVTDAASALARFAREIGDANRNFRGLELSQARGELGDLGVATRRLRNAARRFDELGEKRHRGKRSFGTGLPIPPDWGSEPALAQSRPTRYGPASSHWAAPDTSPPCR